MTIDAWLQAAIADAERRGVPELKPILESLTALPPLDVTYSDETEAELSEVVGGLSVALARTFTIIDPTLRNPATEHWERAFRVFDLLL